MSIFDSLTPQQMQLVQSQGFNIPSDGSGSNFNQNFQGASGNSASKSFNQLQSNNQQTQDQVLQLLKDQISKSEANKELILGKQDEALNILQNALNEGPSEQEQALFESLSADPGDTPFSQMLQSSIQSTIENPEVFSQDQIDSFISQSNEAAAKSVQDAIKSTQIDAAQRGVQGGVPQGLEQQLTMQGASEAIQAQSELKFKASEAAAQNKQFAQQLGVEYDTALSQVKAQKLSTLAQFINEQELQDLELVTGMSEILANTSIENPDFSGFASILSDINQQGNDLLLQKENIALLEQELANQLELGLAGIEQQESLIQEQLKFNQTVSSLQSEIDSLAGDLEQQIEDIEGDF